MNYGKRKTIMCASEVHRQRIVVWKRTGTEWMYNQTAFRLIVTSSLAAYM